MKSTINQEEVAKFTAMAETWWDENGPFKPLHRFNPLRIGYIKQHACQHFKRDKTTKQPLDGITVLDIGCGGGLLAEPLARLGAKITGIDASEKNIAIASIHAQQSNLSINYHATTVEDLAKTGQQFDIVLNMEVVEHVDNVPEFLRCSAQLVKPYGLMVVATLNRTPKSYLLAIIGAEYILRWLPRGTHSWKKFLKPAELAQPLEQSGMRIDEVVGAVFNPLKNTWSLGKDVSVNYMLRAVKADKN